MMNRRKFLSAAAAAAMTAGAQTAKRPNVLFIIFDDWGFGHASAYGAKWVKTPGFDRVAKEGALFTHAFTSNPKCSPCRASILMGRNSWQTREAVSHQSLFPNEFAVYPAAMEKAGYFVGLTGKGWGPGDFKSTGWPHNPAGKSYDAKKTKPPYSGMGPNDYTGNFEDFLSARPKDTPFCFWMGFAEPHRVYEEGSGVRSGKKLADVTVPAYYPDVKLVRSDMLDYAVEVEYADAYITKALDKLAAIGELENTLVIVTSDHGMPFPRVKGQIYEDGFHIPLAVRWGNAMKGGRVINDFITTRDFAPTILEAAGVAKPETITGKSFVDILKSGREGVVDPSREYVMVAKERHDIGRPNDAGYPVRAIRTRQYLYIRNYMPDVWPAGMPETGYRDVDDSPTKTLLISSFDQYYKLSFGKRAAEELYDIEADPGCMKNLFAEPGMTMTKRTLRDKMERILKEEGDPRMNGNAAFFDTIQYTGPKKHSYETWLKNQ
ncbi:MAG: sulfatase [Acidobacteria bacterium]|nr:sulfatase [Acidobacteriota bacterium]